MDNEDEERWRDHVPEPEQVGDSSRISDSAWNDLVSRFDDPSGAAADMPSDEVRERLEETERWQPEPAAPIGWRTASPTLMLSVLAAFGALIALLIGVVFFRPLPGWFLPVSIAVLLGGAVGLFFHLPKQRGFGDDNGAAV
ncbi:hypothetical protein [Brevibacterium sp.]|uniref:hypothetical protein n=1 Tax=Brevibacterium sp. TaxID=1701 RepID=UPI002811C470|nr:hypothetical protein [Brevibacterium sp.]